MLTPYVGRVTGLFNQLSINSNDRLQVLDGWRAISILLVIAAHALPLGPKALRLNEVAGTVGMSLFFALSGFLIVSFLLQRPDPKAFIIRRFFRIVPLAWLGTAIGLVWFGGTSQQWTAHFLFFGNLPPFNLLSITAHFWSLCVEMHFYVLCALFVWTGGRPSLYILPLLGCLITVFRAWSEAPISIETYYRVDEIFSGVCLGLLYSYRKNFELNQFKLAISWVLAGLLLLASHPDFQWFNYFRPYLAAALIGVTIFQPPAREVSFLQHRHLAYIATISYALYIVHPFVLHTWLGSGAGFEKYLKRPLAFAFIWLLAHWSTKYFESYWIGIGKRLTAPSTRSSDT
jgi:peptidoglycan/LPS O-acetylase OafA/YrhL